MFHRMIRGTVLALLLGLAAPALAQQDQQALVDRAALAVQVAGRDSAALGPPLQGRKASTPWSG